MLTLSELKSLIIAVNGQRTIYVQGRAGSGKSSVIKEIVAELKMNFFYDLRLGTEDAATIKGIYLPDLENHTTVETRPHFFPESDDAYGILLIDEFDHAVPAVQSAAYQIILDRKVGKFKLPDNVWIVMASNSKSDGGVHFSPPKPVKNRVIMVRAECSLDEFLAYGKRNGLHQAVLSFVSANPSFLFYESDVDKNIQGNLGAFASPRSWEQVSDIMSIGDAVSVNTFTDAISGSVGIEVAGKYISFISETEFPITARQLYVGKSEHLLSDSDFTNEKGLYTILDELVEILKGVEKPSYKHHLLEFLVRIENEVIAAKYFAKICEVNQKILMPLKKDKDTFEEGMEYREALMEVVSEAL